MIKGYRQRPEHKALDPTGSHTGPETVGRLRRRPLHARPCDILLIGKESNKLAERESGEAAEGEGVLVYGAVGDEWTAWILPRLRRLGSERVAKDTGVSSRTVRRWFAGAKPHDGDSGHYAAVKRAAKRSGNPFES